MAKYSKSIVLISGGMDSAVCAGLASQESDKCFGLHINYGQKTQARELRAFNDICDYYQLAGRQSIDISYLKTFGGSSLTDDNLDIDKGDLESKTIPSSYVPFRNANILAIAASWAEVIEADAIYIGAMDEDSSGYPDCRESFFDSFQETINQGTKPETNIKIETPILHLTKKDIILKGKNIEVPFHLTWSCYKNNDLACGKCDSCLLRLRGWNKANLKDPIEYIV
jgi:7-cyano-7-deazaguanine synthase